MYKVYREKYPLLQKITINEREEGKCNVEKFTFPGFVIIGNKLLLAIVAHILFISQGIIIMKFIIMTFDPPCVYGSSHAVISYWMAIHCFPNISQS